MLDGDRMALSMYNISFKSSFERKLLCTNELGEQDILRLQHAIEDLYYFEFVYGEVEYNISSMTWLLAFQMTSLLEGS